LRFSAGPLQFGVEHAGKALQATGGESYCLGSGGLDNLCGVNNKPDRSIGVRDAEVFFVSWLILLLELLWIRWMGTEIRIFAYLGNLILVVCFFGVGLGCYLAAQPVATSRIGLNFLLLVVLVGNPLRVFYLSSITRALGSFEDSPIWGVVAVATSWKVLAAAAFVLLLVYLLVRIFVPLGQILGRSLNEHPRLIRAYSINIAGSLVGVWSFNLLSWLSTPPAVWLAVSAAVMAALVLCGRRLSWAAVGLVAAAAMVIPLGESLTKRTVWSLRSHTRSVVVRRLADYFITETFLSQHSRILWSPYYRLTLTPEYIREDSDSVLWGYILGVNNTWYQMTINLSPAFVQSHPTLFDPSVVERSYYNLPFRFKPTIHRMLILGAGMGNNAAAALRHGVAQIDCVEIDPQIYALGKELHPEHPYDSPHVRVIVNDARAFYKQAQGRYDAIWLSLLDSHTLGSSYTNLRLDHYVYTTEAFAEARRLLTDDGLLIVNFDSPRPWVADRLFGELRQVFGHDPIAYCITYPAQYGTDGGISLVCANTPLRTDDISDEFLRRVVAETSLRLPGSTRLTTDDWPYLYLERAKVPKLHFVTSLAILGAVLLAQRRLVANRRSTDWHFFALGAAFLLLEVQTVSRATLLFGMTWIVNAIVISAVLVMILLANLAAWRWPRLPLSAIIAGLAITVAALAFVPLDWFNTLTTSAKLVAASAFLTAPVFFAGLIFIRSFAACADKARALGSNLIGALVGGLLESVSFVTGIRALVILIGLFYLFAILRRPAAVRR
jgi:spermidine synthase